MSNQDQAARGEELRIQYELQEANKLRIKTVEDARHDIEGLAQLLKDEPKFKEALEFAERHLPHRFVCEFRIDPRKDQYGHGELAKFQFEGEMVRSHLRQMAEAKIAEVDSIKSVDAGVMAEGLESVGAPKLIAALANATIENQRSLKKIDAVVKKDAGPPAKKKPAFNLNK